MTSDSEDDLFTRCEKRFWDTCRCEINEMEKFKDTHPAIITDEDSAIQVIVANTDQEFKCLQEVTLKQFVSNLQQREQSALHVAKKCRNRVQELERQLDGASLELERCRIEGKRSISYVREFWRNRVYEKVSRGGRMVMAALCN